MQCARCESYDDLDLGPRAIYGVAGWTETYFQMNEVDKMIDVSTLPWEGPRQFSAYAGVVTETLLEEMLF